jgi:hypothetical protein
LIHNYGGSYFIGGIVDVGALAGSPKTGSPQK